jgi:hypothetical protein
MTFSSDVPQDQTLKVKRISDTSLLKAFLTKLGPSLLVVIFKSRKLIDVLSQLSDVTKFLLWQIETFGFVKIFTTKKKLIKYLIVKCCLGEEKYSIYEFGVAHGYLTKYILSLENKLGNFIKEYNGYDTFEGLPFEYRNFKAGSFSNQGKFPEIRSAKLKWFKGFVEESVDHQTFNSDPKIIILDLDLLGPTKHVMSHLLPMLNEFDILYFDEGFDEGEFSILSKELVPNIDFEYLGTTGQGLAIRFKGWKYFGN